MSPRFASKSAAITRFGFIGSWIVGSTVTSSRQPVAAAAPSAHAVKRRRSSFPDSLVSAAREGERAERHGQRHTRARARGRDDVVTAGVTDARQRVVLGHDRDRRPGPGALDRRAECRGEPPDGPLDLHVVRLEELGEPRVGLLLLEGELGIVVDSVREGLELVGEAGPGRRNPGLQRFDPAALRAALNAACAFPTSDGSASRSSVVSAIAFAAVSIPSRASALFAAASKAREWIGVPSGAIFTIGWIAGITWLTLPMSEEPRRP